MAFEIKHLVTTRGAALVFTMPPKIKLVAKTDAEIALEKRYVLLRKQRAGTAAGPSAAGAKNVGDQGDRNKASSVASSSKKHDRNSTPPKPKFVLKDPGAPKPMTAFERTKLILANEAEKKRKEAETKKQLDAMRKEKNSLDEPSFVIPKSNPLPSSGGLPKNSPSLKRPASRTAGQGFLAKKQRDTSAVNDITGYTETTTTGYQPTAIQNDDLFPKITEKITDPNQRTVFIADLPDLCSVEAIGTSLYRFGNVEEVRVVEGRNFGFVTFAEQEGAVKAVRASEAAAAGETQNHVLVNEQTVSVRFARRSVKGEQKNEHAYAAEIKNKAALMAQEEINLRETTEPEEREMVCYDDI